MFKKGKIGKFEYQIAFEFRSLKWFVLEVTLFSVFFELMYMYFKTKKIESNTDLYFNTFISSGIWEVLFYATMIIAIIGIGFIVGGDKKNYNGLLALRTLPIDIKDIVLSKTIVSVVSILVIYGSQLLSLMFAWSLFADNVPSAKRVDHALNYALVKDPFIYACFPNTIIGLLINIVVIILLCIGSVYIFYAIKTSNRNKIIIGAMFFGVQVVAAILLILLKVRTPFVHAKSSAVNGDVAIQLAIVGVIYLALNVLTCINMYKEFEYEA